MLPIAVLPAAGLLLGIGGALSNPNTVEAYPFLDVGWLQSVFTVMASAGAIVFANLAVLFAVGVAVGWPKATRARRAGLADRLSGDERHHQCAVENQRHAGHAERRRAGAGNASRSRRWRPGCSAGGHRFGDLVSARPLQQDSAAAVPGLFGGSRFVPIVSSLAAMAVGALMTVVWPPFQRLIFGMGGMVDASGYLGTFIYGFVLRMLGPFGLHHIFYLPFWTTALGGSEVINGQLVEGTQRISSPSWPTRIRSSSTSARHVSCPAALSP